MAFVTLVLVDHREQQFAAMMAMLEDSLDLLVERGDLAIAADAADALRAAAENPALSEEQRRRVEASLGRLTKPEDIRTMAHALRIYHTGSDENQAARRLLTSLGPLAIDPLLEQLADEQEMAVRKSLVELLSEMAPSYLSEVGAHVSDARWYVVRNVVSILASAHSSATLPYLERTLRHYEVRVRRETIRALSGINDRVAHAMLVNALTDEDAQNVQLAARYLGTAKVALGGSLRSSRSLAATVGATATSARAWRRSKRSADSGRRRRCPRSRGWQAGARSSARARRASWPPPPKPRFIASELREGVRDG